MRLGRWRERKRYAKQLEEMGITPDDAAALKEMDRATAISRLRAIQDEYRGQLADAGLDIDATLLQVGVHCEWIDVNQMVFRVLGFDRNGTTVELDAGAQSVEARSVYEPYGYLLVESPTLNQPVRLPIIHRDDFYLASTVFDDPLFRFPEGAELLVTYAPKNMDKRGLSVSPHHVLHYALLPQGTLERYYPDDGVGDRRMSRPEPQLIFGPFKYDGVIRVATNADLQL